LERAYRASDADYLLVRPVGIGEDVVPSNEWVIQDTDDFCVEQLNMAKLDVARYIVQEALSPTKSKDAVYIGGVMKETIEQQ
jgi:hypothetical protein